MAGIDKILASAVDSVRKSGVIESGTLMGTVDAVGSDGTLSVSRGPDTYPRVRLLSGYAPAAGDLVEILRTAGGWVCIGKLMGSAAPQKQSGFAATSAAGATNSWSQVTVTFPVPFDSTPVVVVSPRYAGTTTSQFFVLATIDESPTGFTLKAYRTNNAGTSASWIATI